MANNLSKNTDIGRLFLVLICILIIYLIFQFDSTIKTELRSWMQATGSCSIPVVVAYWVRQNQKKDEQEKNQAEAIKNQELKERQEENDYKEYLTQISGLLIKCDFNKPIEQNVEFKILQYFFATILKQFKPARKTQIISFFKDVGNFDDGKISIFQNLKLHRADLSNVIASDVDFSGVLLWHGKFFQADLRCSKFSNARLRYSDFTESVLNNTDFSNAELQGCKFINARLPNARLSGLNLIGKNEMQCTLVQCDFSEAWLEGCKFNGSNLFWAKLVNVKAKKANFQGANLESVNFEGAHLHEADLRDANLVNTNFKGAILDKTKLSKHLTKEQIEQCVTYKPDLVGCVDEM